MYDVSDLMAGYYTHINTLADVQENVMEYLHVLSRPMVIDHDHDIIWTEAYMDTVVRTDSLLVNHYRGRGLSCVNLVSQSQVMKVFLLKAVQSQLLNNMHGGRVVDTLDVR